MSTLEELTKRLQGVTEDSDKEEIFACAMQTAGHMLLMAMNVSEAPNYVTATFNVGDRTLVVTGNWADGLAPAQRLEHYQRKFEEISKLAYEAAQQEAPTDEEFYELAMQVQLRCKLAGVPPASAGSFSMGKQAEAARDEALNRASTWRAMLAKRQQDELSKEELIEGFIEDLEAIAKKVVL